MRDPATAKNEAAKDEAAKDEAAKDDPPLRTPLLRDLVALVRKEFDPQFSFRSEGPLPWTPPHGAAGARVVLVTTGGLHRLGDAPFRALEEPLGDTSFREIPHGTPSSALALDAPYVDRKYTPSDPEVALPMAALEALGVVPAPAHFSFCGGILRPMPGLARSAEQLAARLPAGPTIAILLPTCSICVQTVCLLAREIEARGIPTVALSLLRELSEIVGAPRTLVVPFPFGAPAGDPGHAALHRAVLREALDVVQSAQQPGEIVLSRLAWRRTPGP